MSAKTLFLHYTVNTVLTGLKLAPVTPLSGVRFLRSDSYTPHPPNAYASHTDVVITDKNIEIYEYSPDPRDSAHQLTSCASSTDFLRAFVQQRIDSAIPYQLEFSKEAKKLTHSNHDVEAFVQAAAKLEKDKAELKQKHYAALEKKLNGLFVRFASLILGI